MSIANDHQCEQMLMSKRDLAAIALMQGLLSSGEKHFFIDPAWAAQIAVSAADALIAALEAK